MQLNYSKLFQQQSFIDGAFVDADNKKTFAVFNPCTGEELGVVPECGAQETQRAIAAAQAALEGWKNLAPRERGHILTKWYQLIEEHTEDLGKIVSLECGKPINEGIGEVAYGNAFVEWCAQEAWHITGDAAKLDNPKQHMIVMKEAKGVVAAITPWNFPSAMITRKVAPALAAGCTVVVKPAEDTPFSALALAVLAQEAGIPKGVFNVVTGIPVEIGTELCQNFDVRHLSFTGSTEVGKWLMAHSADTLKTLSLELGGNAPFIIFDDANLDEAVAGLMASKFRNTGQTCVCANRIFVHEDIYAAFVAKLTAAVKALKIGDSLDKDTQITVLINQAGLAKVKRLVDDAKQKGAKVICGGEINPDYKLGYLPTILEDINEDMAIMHEEIFGPVITLTKFTDEQAVIAEANCTKRGLASYFYSQDVHRCWRVAEQLQSGIVSVNTGIFSNAAAPFGGMKESGFGREGSKHAIEEYLELKYINI